MLRFLIPATLACLFLLSANAGAQEEPIPFEGVRICDAYGTGFFYVPGTEQCYRPTDGQIRYETENGTVITETPFAARVRELESAAAIANALEDPDLVAGESFGLRVNWGAAGSHNAIGITGAMLLGDNLAGGGAKMTGSAGLGYSDGYVGARFGVQLYW